MENLPSESPVRQLLHLDAEYTLFVKKIYLCKLEEGVHKRIVIIKNYVLQNCHVEFFNLRGSHVRRRCRCDTDLPISAVVTIQDAMQCMEPRPDLFQIYLAQGGNASGSFQF